MKVPLSWLKEFIPFEQSAEELAHVLTLAGLEVETIEKITASFSGVVVVKVIEVFPHPNAEKLKIATVSDGKGEYTIVCGAPNCRIGIKSALATIGAILTNEEGKPRTIKASKLRGIESEGMLCSPKELGLSHESAGIIELPEEMRVGADLAHFYEETVLDISLTPNLGHAMSLLGIARELSAFLQMKIKKPTISFKEEKAPPSLTDMLSLRVEDRENCPRYACRLVQGVTIEPSPSWLQRKLELSGLRSVNNVVDIGNFVMLELGQPLHLFDYDSIHEKKLIVSSRTSFAHLLTLDDKMRKIPQETLLICDSLKPLAIAGIMGGKDSAITPTTKNVLIESAYFSPESIRRSSKQLHLRTDASQRFEREVDLGSILEALDRAAQLLQTIAGGKIVHGVIDFSSRSFPQREIVVRISRINSLLGIHLSVNEMTSLFERLDCTIKKQTEEILLVAVPTYRNDLKEEIDCIEEIARLYGFNNFEKKSPLHLSSSLLDTPLYTFESRVRTDLLKEGLQEFLTCNLISPKLAELTAEGIRGMGEKNQSAISVLYPTSIDQSILRFSLLPGLLEVIKKNQDHQIHDISAFEVGGIHFKEHADYVEQTAAGIILTGKSRPHHWESKPKDVDFFDLKGIVENLLDGLLIENVTFEPSHLHNFHPHRQAHIKSGDLFIGALGEIHPSHLAALEIIHRVYYAELNLHELFSLKRPEHHFLPFVRFPGSERDWTLSLTLETPIQAVFEAIQSTPSRFLEKLLLLDLYKSAQIGKNRKNATLRFYYRDPHKTIALEAVEKEHARLVQEVAKKLHDHLI
jgi:phenylalanyl-tRNA synthetase beta chain